VCVGRLSRQKAQDVLLTAWPAVRAALPSATCVLVGDGPDREALESAAPDSVVLAGQVEDPRDWYAAADVVVLPSRYETNPLAVIEAMASERCVVVSDVPSVCEPLPAGSEAAAAVEDPPALAAALVPRLADRPLAAREAAANLAHVRREHDVARSTAALRELYQHLTHGRLT
jgi:glycosyltransferase involved in cell wall biosynthesis